RGGDRGAPRRVGSNHSAGLARRKGLAGAGDEAIDSARWNRIQAVFHAAADLPETEQAAYVATQCADDAELARAVLAMLRQDRGTSLLDHDVAHAAALVLGKEQSIPLPSGQFGPYRIRSVLGEGGMGVVYLGQRDDLGSLAAIKILRDASL